MEAVGKELSGLVSEAQASQGPSARAGSACTAGAQHRGEDWWCEVMPEEGARRGSCREKNGGAVIVQGGQFGGVRVKPQLRLCDRSPSAKD